jgi:hypothetical protein
MIPRKFEPVLFGFILSGLMSLIVSGISTLKVTGPGPGVLGRWAPGSPPGCSRSRVSSWRHRWRAASAGVWLPGSDRLQPNMASRSPESINALHARAVLSSS